MKPTKQRISRGLLLSIGEAKIRDSLKEINEAFDILEEEIIREYSTGERCLHCGGKKENPLSEWCSKCLENE